MKIELDSETAEIVLQSVFADELSKAGGLAATFSKQILASVPRGVQAGYAKGLSLHVDPESELGRMLRQKGLI